MSPQPLVFKISARPIPAEVRAKFAGMVGTCSKCGRRGLVLELFHLYRRRSGRGITWLKQCKKCRGKYAAALKRKHRAEGRVPRKVKSVSPPLPQEEAIEMIRTVLREQLRDLVNRELRQAIRDEIMRLIVQQEDTAEVYAETTGQQEYLQGDRYRFFSTRKR